MNNWIRLPGFPPPEKQDSVRFYVLKSITYSTRMLLYLMFMSVGFAIQIIMMNAWPGAVFLICATLLNLVQGYDSRARLKAFDVDSNWTGVDMDRIHEVEKLDDRITRWNMDALDISNGLGIFSLILVGIGVYFLSGFLRTYIGYQEVGTIFITNVIILILPLWFNGIKRVLKQDNLRVKIDIVKKMEEHFQKVKKEGENFKPALMLARNEEDKSMPTDTRFTISFDDMPSDFYGIQAQINLNVVQGASYPYFYCVIPAKVGYGLEKYIDKIPKVGKVIVEFQIDKQAEVIVIRQYTTKTSGYHTKINSCKNILNVTLEAARIILKQD
ncbi:hypothetical protein RBH29_09155 [Herbivorax sp. ANBcel31]|uniref:hypothetical protein n=1 Tax=Herbivorax sp. ANBcel31 TaxID=3069754 RepID=UPI0027B0C39C|nr:hypothetical protein [Herbivorax sp. ANBcel31]MDQ2086589.1 hypothetical protein [Herbivorax sp. ANBcel31]